MKRMLLTILGPLFGMMLLLLGVHLFNAPPKYKTVPLPAWLAGFDGGAGAEARAGAIDAVRALQLKCVPLLMDYLKAEESTAQNAISKRVDTDSLGITAANPVILQHRAVAAFEILATNAAPAIPDLAALLQRPDSALNAAKSLAHLGPAALRAFQQAITNENSTVRIIAAESLGRHKAATSLSLLLSALRDSDPAVRGTAADSLRHFPESAEMIIPHLIPLLGQADGFVHNMAARTLGTFGAQARAAIPALQELSEKQIGDSPARTAIAKISADNLLETR